MCSKKDSTPKFSFSFSFSVIWQQWEAMVGTIISCSSSCPKRKKKSWEKKSQAAYFVSKIFRGKVADDTGIWTSAMLNLMIPPVIKKNSFQATLQKVESSPLVTPAMWLRIFWDEHWLFGQEAARCGEEGIYSVFLNKPYNWHCGKRKVHTHTKSKIQAYQNLSFQQLSVWRTAFS